MKIEAFTAKNVIKRNGQVVTFDPHKIRGALLANALDARGHKGGSIESLSQSDRDLVSSLTDAIVERIARNANASVSIEDIQDQVELALMRAGDLTLARSYLLYRSERAKARALTQTPSTSDLLVSLEDGSSTTLDTKELVAQIQEHSSGLDVPPAADIVARALQQCYSGIPVTRVHDALLMAVRERMEMFPDASWLAARMLIADILREVVGAPVPAAGVKAAYMEQFGDYVRKGVQAGLLDERLSQFDLKRLAHALEPGRDQRFDYLGIDTVYDRYLLHIDGKRIELPQWLYMRVAMGLALNEVDREARAIEFYDVLSSGDFVCSTPTLFNAGTRRPQLSSCFLTTVSDDLEGIYEAFREDALLSKYAGGLGNDWTSVRALGSHIKGTNGKSQGVVPFLKVANDTAAAVNQGGKRKGAICAYLETWHLDIEEFLDLRKNTGDDRRRTHDMNTANWIPDLFMKRVIEDAQWTLFSPNEVSDLHDLYGRAFEARYLAYEAAAARGEIRNSKQVSAKDLWRRMLGMLFETGHPWLTFKDPCNIRSPQQHVGVVHSSNLCTEITLNTSDSEIAVCNLGSVNLVNHLGPKEDGSLGLDDTKLEATVRTAMRMLDNVIDINLYAVPKARTSNLKHRPVGLGIMGFHDLLQELRVPYGSKQAVEIAGVVQEHVSYFAYSASNCLARERGRYGSYAGSLWDQGLLPHETVAKLVAERGIDVGFEIHSDLEQKWIELKADIERYGMRNSNCVAIAPTATISNIAGVSQSIEPIYQNLYVKSNLGGEYTMVNRRLVSDLKKAGLWDESMVLDLKHYEGSVGRIERVPQEIRELYATAFEIEPVWLIEAAARRQIWLDQAQSLNVYMANASGKKLDELYKLAWERGLKTTYYLRTLSATHVEKSTGRIGALNAVAAEQAVAVADQTEQGPVCMISPDDPRFSSCEACQ